MKILYVIHSLPVGGAEKVVVDYLKKLKFLGEDVVLLEISHCESFLSAEVTQSGIPYCSLLKNNLFERVRYRFFPFSFIGRFNHLVKKINPDIIHFQTIYRYVEKMHFPLSRCVFTFHARVDRAFNTGKWVKPLYERLANTEMQFVVISSKVEEDLRHYLPTAHIHFIPNGIDIDAIRTQKCTKEEVRKELGIDNDAFVVGQVGRFTDVKNHLFTIDVFNVIAKRESKSELILIGAGTTQETDSIKQRIASYQLQNKVRFLGVRNDATRLMTGFDVLIQPSFSESFSLVLIEAQVNNVKCVASDAIPSEVVCNNNSFQLSLEDSKEKWADVIMGNGARRTNNDISLFDINNVVSQHLHLYKSMLDC